MKKRSFGLININRYHIQKEGDEKALDLVFNEADQSWYVETDGESIKLLK